MRVFPQRSFHHSYRDAQYTVCSKSSERCRFSFLKTYSTTPLPHGGLCNKYILHKNPTTLAVTPHMPPSFSTRLNRLNIPYRVSHQRNVDSFHPSTTLTGTPSMPPSRARALKIPRQIVHEGSEDYGCICRITQLTWMHACHRIKEKVWLQKDSWRGRRSFHVSS